MSYNRSQTKWTVKYYGSVSKESRYDDRAIGKIGGQARGSFKSVRSLIRKRDIPKKSKQVMYQAYYVPMLT